MSANDGDRTAWGDPIQAQRVVEALEKKPGTDAEALAVEKAADPPPSSEDPSETPD